MANQVTVISLLALDLLRDRALRKPAIAKAFIALLRTAADRLDEDRSAGALTGPAARADLAILRLHLRLLDGERRDLQNAYRLLSTEAVRMSLDRGSITPGAARRAIRLLSSWRRRGRKSQSPAR
jgi:predicted short-subunit dehydrogenase-like oxidoreductase (DUF2520 family)